MTRTRWYSINQRVYKTLRNTSAFVLLALLAEGTFIAHLTRDCCLERMAADDIVPLIFKIMVQYHAAEHINKNEIGRRRESEE